MKKSTKIIIHVGIIVFALLFLSVGNQIASKGTVYNFYTHQRFPMAEAKVIRVLEVTQSDAQGWEQTVTTFEARILTGEHKGTTTIAVHAQRSPFQGIVDKAVESGDKIIMTLVDELWYYSSYVHTDKIIALALLFAILLLVFGKIKGLNSILALGFTAGAIFAIFIPAILSGKNIYAAAIIVCVFSTITTLFIVYGVTRQSIASAIGCFGGVIASGLLALFMNNALRITGVLDTETQSLLFFPTEIPIDLKAVVFAGIIIGALGAIMDVSVSIASSLAEIKQKAPDLNGAGLFKSGMNIGRDIMGSMTNTLVLAYVGSSIMVILLLLVNSSSMLHLLNREIVLVEFLQTLIGSLGLLLTIPLTALVCAVLYSGGKGLGNDSSNHNHSFNSDFNKDEWIDMNS